MSENPWVLSDDEDEVEMDAMKVHVPVALISQLKAIAAIETQAKKKRKPRTARVTSLSKLVAEIGSRFVLGWCEAYHFDPRNLPKAPDERGGVPSDEIVRAGHSVAAQQERDEKKKK